MMVPIHIMRTMGVQNLRLDGCLQVPLDGLDSTVEPYSPLLGSFGECFWMFLDDDFKAETLNHFSKGHFGRTQTLTFTVGVWMSLGFTSGKPED